MYIKGTSYDEALKEAQEMGIAETNPSYDVEGKDTANKIVLICNRLFGTSKTLNDIDIKGISKVSLNDISEAKKAGKVIKLIGIAKKNGEEINLSVGPKLLNEDHPLSKVWGSEKAITYDTDTMGEITVMGGKSSQVGAAAALLKDLINAFV
jgi:homoserine dehydrogenase